MRWGPIYTKMETCPKWRSRISTNPAVHAGMLISRTALLGPGPARALVKSLAGNGGREADVRTHIHLEFHSCRLAGEITLHVAMILVSTELRTYSLEPSIPCVLAPAFLSLNTSPASNRWQLHNVKHFEAPPMKNSAKTFNDALIPGNSLRTSSRAGLDVWSVP